MKIISLREIKENLDIPLIVKMQEKGFEALSNHQVIVPPVGYLKIKHTPVSYHIKYGTLINDDFFVVKLAGGLEQTTEEFGPSKIEGLMLVVSAINGKPLYLLEDEGYLTYLRTAVAGFIAAKYLAPKKVEAIGVLGTGVQARMQVEMLKNLTQCRRVYVWGRNQKNVKSYQCDMQKQGFDVCVSSSPQDVAKASNLIITATACDQPLLKAKDLKKGTHITAVGADSPNKQELDPDCFLKADLIVVDSKKQCVDHGEIRKACKLGLISEDQIFELGDVVSNAKLKRSSEDIISIIDLTGVAVQDLQIAKSIIMKLRDN